MLEPLTDPGREFTDPTVGRAILREGEPQALVVARPGVPPAAPAPRSPAAARIIRDVARLVEAGREPEAIPLLQEAARLDPANPLTRFDLGLALLRCGRVDDAVNSLAHATWLDDTMAKAHYHLGDALSRRGELTAAIAALRAAIARAPKFADAQIRLGDLLRARGSIAEAAEAFEKGAAAGPNTTTGRRAAARALVIRNRPDDAATLLRRARALDPKSIDLVRQLADSLIEAGRFDEAEDAFTQALALDPADAPSYYGLTGLRKLMPKDRPLLERMTRLLQADRISEHERMLLHFGLGKAHDDLREFEAAIGHFDAANRIRSRTAPLDRKTVVRFVDRNIELFRAGANSFDPALGVDDERPVFILGLPRSGTTLVEQILSSHPAVAAGGELGFWGEHSAAALAPEAQPFSRASLHELARGYQAVLRGISADALRVTDKNPFNYQYIGLVRLAFPRAFIIHCRRHPVDTCLSIYTTSLAAREIAFTGNRDDLVFYHGEYSRLMRHWREVLPPGRFLEIDYEALVSDPEVETRRLVSFCELEWHDACLRPEGNRRTVSTASAWQARQPVYRSSVERWRNYRPWLGPLADLLSETERTD